MKETKSVRLNLLLRPSLFDDLRRIAWLNHTSVNNLINTIAEEYISSFTKEDKNLENKNIAYGRLNWVTKKKVQYGISDADVSIGAMKDGYAIIFRHEAAELFQTVEFAVSGDTIFFRKGVDGVAYRCSKCGTVNKRIQIKGKDADGLRGLVGHYKLFKANGQDIYFVQKGNEPC